MHKFESVMPKVFHIRCSSTVEISHTTVGRHSWLQRLTAKAHLPYKMATATTLGGIAYLTSCVHLLSQPRQHRWHSGGRRFIAYW